MSGTGGGRGGGKKRPGGPRQPRSMRSGGPGGPGGGPSGPSSNRRPGGPSSGARSGGYSSGRPAGPGGTRGTGGRQFRKAEGAPGPSTRRDAGPSARTADRREKRQAFGDRPEKPRFSRPEPRPRMPEREAPSVYERHDTPPEDKVMGINAVLELLRSTGRTIDTVYVDKEKGGTQFGEIITIARREKVPVKIVPREALDKLSNGLRHQGVVASVTPKEYADPHRIVEDALKKGGFPLLVVLDGVEDPQNLGAVIRTAEAAGADGVIIPEHRAAHLTAAVARASAGALEYMPVAKVTNLAGFITYLKEKGFWVVGFSGDAKADYTSFDMSVPLAVVLGSEGTGIRPVVKDACDALLALPMLGRISSLNVSVSAGIAIYEVLRQRKEKSCNKS